MSLADVRDDVYLALVDGLDGVLEAESVHPYIPDELAVPAVWVDSPIELRTYDRAELIAVASVLIVVDGADSAQLAYLDHLTGAVWLAVESVGVGTGAVGVLLGAGGPTLHAVRVTVEVPIAARTLCPPALATLILTP